MRWEYFSDAAYFEYLTSINAPNPHADQVTA
jgi:hypothetical protein